MTFHRHDVKIEQEEMGGPIKLWIDGKENPLTIARHPITVDVGVGGMTLLTVAIICETLDVQSGALRAEDPGRPATAAEILHGLEAE